MPTMPKPQRFKAVGKRHRVISPVATPRLRGRKLQDRNERLYRRRPLCVTCLESGTLTEVRQWDHVIPLSVGGGDTAANLQGLCQNCHREKTLAEDAERRRGRGG